MILITMFSLVFLSAGAVCASITLSVTLLLLKEYAIIGDKADVKEAIKKGTEEEYAHANVLQELGEEGVEETTLNKVNSFKENRTTVKPFNDWY